MMTGQLYGESRRNERVADNGVDLYVGVGTWIVQVEPDLVIDQDPKTVVWCWCMQIAAISLEWISSKTKLSCYLADRQSQ